MAKMKKGRWSPEEVANIIGIPKDSKTHGKLMTVSKKLGRPFSNVYAKWAYELKNKTNGSNGKSSAIMTFEFDPNYEGKGTEVQAAEKKSMEAGLDKQILKLLPGKGSLNIPTRLERHAKVYLEKKYSEHVWAFHSTAGNPKIKKLMMKA